MGRKKEKKVQIDLESKKNNSTLKEFQFEEVSNMVMGLINGLIEDFQETHPQVNSIDVNFDGWIANQEWIPRYNLILDDYSTPFIKITPSTVSANYGELSNLVEAIRIGSSLKAFVGAITENKKYCTKSEAIDLFQTLCTTSRIDENVSAYVRVYAHLRPRQKVKVYRMVPEYHALLVQDHLYKIADVKSHRNLDSTRSSIIAWTQQLYHEFKTVQF